MKNIHPKRKNFPKNRQEDPQSLMKVKKKMRKEKEKKSPSKNFLKKRNIKEKKKIPEPMNNSCLIATHTRARTCVSSSEDVTRVVDEAICFAHECDPSPKTLEEEEELRKQKLIDEKTWSSFAAKDLNLFIAILMEMMNQEEKGFRWRHRPSALQKRLNSVFRKNK